MFHFRVCFVTTLGARGFCGSLSRLRRLKEKGKKIPLAPRVLCYVLRAKINTSLKSLPTLLLHRLTHTTRKKIRLLPCDAKRLANREARRAARKKRRDDWGDGARELFSRPLSLSAPLHSSPIARLFALLPHCSPLS